VTESSWLLSVDDISSIIQSVAVSAVAIPAFLGINSWRKEHVGKRKLQLAEEVLAATYELQSVIEWVRHPASGGDEGNERPNREDEPINRQRLNDAYYSRIARLKADSQQFSKLHAIRPVFRAYFGERAQEPLQVLFTTRNRINSAVAALINQREGEELPVELRRHYESIIWDMSTPDEPDQVKREVNLAVSQLEAICFPILRTK